MANLKQRVMAAAMAVLTTGTLTMGTVGGNLTAQSEGYHKQVYLDPVGIPTVCYGHTDPNLRLGMTFTDAECDTLFKADNVTALSYITGSRRCIGSAKLTNNQIDALRDFVFNVGGGAFCRSTMAKHIKAGHMDLASAEFPKWVKAGKRVLPGLVTRRANEQQLFNSRVTFVPYQPKDLAVMGSAKANQ